MTLPCGLLETLVLIVLVSPASSRILLASAVVAPTSPSGTFTFGGPLDTNSLTVESFATLVPAAGSVLITVPLSYSALGSCTTSVFSSKVASWAWAACSRCVASEGILISPVGLSPPLLNTAYPRPMTPRMIRGGRTTRAAVLSAVLPPPLLARRRPPRPPPCPSSYSYGGTARVP